MSFHNLCFCLEIRKNITSNEYSQLMFLCRNNEKISTLSGLKNAMKDLLYKIDKHHYAGLKIAMPSENVSYSCTFA